MSRWTTSNGAADAGRRRVDHELRARVEDLLAVVPRLEPELGAEVDRAEQRARPRAGCDGRLEREAQPQRRLDDRDHGQAARSPSAATASGVAFGSTTASSASPSSAAHRPRQTRRVGAVDPDEPRGARRSTRRAAVTTSVRAAAFSAGATASSRSATTASASESSAAASLRSSLPGAKRRERRCGSTTAVARRLYVRHSAAVNRVVSARDRSPLDSASGSQT